MKNKETQDLKMVQTGGFESRLTRALELVLAGCLLAITTVVVTLVVMRYLFNTRITGANELTTLLFVYATSIGAALAIGKQEHIAISFAVDALPVRIQRSIDRLSLILIAFFHAVVLSESLGWIHVTGDYLMPATGLPREVAQRSVPIGCGLAILFCLLRLLFPLRPTAELARPVE